METEVFLSGYCRCLDNSRMVEVEFTQGQWQADCQYGECPYEGACRIAQQITELGKSERKGSMAAWESPTA